MPGKIRVSAAVALGACLVAAPVAAHPLGNFSVNRYAAIRIEPEAIEVRYVVDMAEIPTFQEMQEWGLRAQADQPETMSYLARQSDALGRGQGVFVQEGVEPALAEALAPYRLNEAARRRGDSLVRLGGKFGDGEDSRIRFRLIEAIRVADGGAQRCFGWEQIGADEIHDAIAWRWRRRRQASGNRGKG